MCGIAGFWAPDCANPAQHPGTVLKAMADAIRHRGPDAEGYWESPAIGLGLAHRRLSILDLSSAGAQPMQSASGRYVIVYNGEIYNHSELRARLAGEGLPTSWRGHSDTETLLAAIEAWGLQGALEAASGMFALALWDTQKRTLALARDRLGEKPLFYGHSGQSLVFASELKAICAYPGFKRKIDPEAAAGFLRYSYVPAPLSIFEGIGKLMPGHIAVFRSPNMPPDITSYWSLGTVIGNTADLRSAQFPLAHHAANIEAVLKDVIASQMISDVPIGAFLSGGIDSSLITALMQADSDAPVHTFSIGFEDPRYNEAQHAAAMAQHLGTEHTELILTEQDILDLAPDVTSIYDEPFADSSLLPTILLSKMTRKHVTVALSGDGGDEMFAGYNRHIHGPKLWNYARRVPKFGRSAVHSVATLGERLAMRFPDTTKNVMKRMGLAINLPEKLARFGQSFAGADNMEKMYDLLVATGQQISAPAAGYAIAQSIHRTDDLTLTAAEHFKAWDALSYLPDDIMVKVDRASMASSLETRTPFLDKRSIEAAWSVPIEHKLGQHGSKTVLREILYRYAPKALVERPKQGFAIPLNDWLRAGLFEWGRKSIAAYDQYEELQPFAKILQQAWHDHQSGRRQNGALLFNAIILADWTTNVKRTSVSGA